MHGVHDKKRPYGAFFSDGEFDSENMTEYEAPYDVRPCRFAKGIVFEFATFENLPCLCSRTVDSPCADVSQY